MDGSDYLDLTRHFDENMTGRPDLHLERYQILPPPPLTHNPVILTIAGVYAVLFVIGLTGNVVVLTVMCQIRKPLKSVKENSFIFIMALCLVDLMVIGSLPLTISKVVLNQWIFGETMCKIYWLFESAGKILSSFILSAMGFCRFIKICHPEKRKIHSRQWTMAILLCLVLAACLLLSPLVWVARLRNAHIDMYGTVRLDSQLAFFMAEECIVYNLDNWSFRILTVVLFTFGYCMPAVTLITFYTAILLKLKQHMNTSLATSTIPMRKVTARTLGLLTFYAVCWSPYWCGSLLFSLGLHQNSDTFVYFMYFIHTLPFVNSAFNWIFYALLNTQLRDMISNNNRTTRSCSADIPSKAVRSTCTSPLVEPRGERENLLKLTRRREQRRVRSALTATTSTPFEIRAECYQRAKSDSGGQIRSEFNGCPKTGNGQVKKMSVSWKQSDCSENLLESEV